MPRSDHPKDCGRTPLDFDWRNSNSVADRKPNARSHADSISNPTTDCDAGADSDPNTNSDADRHVRSFGDAGSNLNCGLANYYPHLTFRSLEKGRMARVCRHSLVTTLK